MWSIRKRKAWWMTSTNKLWTRKGNEILTSRLKLDCNSLWLKDWIEKTRRRSRSWNSLRRRPRKSILMSTTQWWSRRSSSGRTKRNRGVLRDLATSHSKKERSIWRNEIRRRRTCWKSMTVWKIGTRGSRFEDLSRGFWRLGLIISQLTHTGRISRRLLLTSLASWTRLPILHSDDLIRSWWRSLWRRRRTGSILTWARRKLCTILRWTSSSRSSTLISSTSKTWRWRRSRDSRKWRKIFFIRSELMSIRSSWLKKKSRTLRSSASSTTWVIRRRSKTRSGRWRKRRRKVY